MLWSAFILGLLGSLHCVGMCGPIALALPGKGLGGRLLYNAGRISTYASIGFISGLLGMGILLAGAQQYLSVLLGSIMLSLVLLSLLHRKAKWMQRISQKPFLWVQHRLGPLLSNPRWTSLYLIGLLNGLLPCGFVYVALSGALLSHAPLSGALFMAFFGLGTVPAMLAVSMMRQFFGIRARNVLRRASPVFLSVLALLLIARGLNLGIPMLSPKVNNTGSGPHMNCCHK